MTFRFYTLLFPALFFISCASSPLVSESHLDRQTASITCEQLFKHTESEVQVDAPVHEKDYLNLYREYKSDTGKVNQILMRNILLRSQQLEAKLRKDKIAQYDFVLIGAGIHSGVVLSEIKELVPNARILVLEKSKDALGVFGRTGETFYGNTLESDLPGTIHTADSNREKLKEASRNYIPNAPVQTYDLAVGHIPQASDFAAPVIATYDKYKPDILFDVQVDHLTPKEKGGFSFKLPRDMSVIDGKLGGIGIGLGEANVPTMNKAGKDFVKKEKDAVFIEDILEQAQKAKRSPELRKEFIRKFKDKDVSLLGGGHGSAIVIDLLLGYGPPDFYREFPLENFKPKSITWVGLKDPQGRTVTGDVFKEFIGGGQRYNHLADRIDDGTIKVISQNCFIEPGKNKAVGLYFWNKETHQYEVDGNGNRLGFETDFVAYAAGYNNNPITKLLWEYSPSGSPYQTVLIKGDIEPNDSRMTRKNVNLGKEVLNKEGKPAGVFLYGPSAGPIAEAADPGGAASPVINVMASRSKSLGRRLVERFRNWP